jgi:hypothetical protein
MPSDTRSVSPGAPSTLLGARRHLRSIDAPGGRSGPPDLKEANDANVASNKHSGRERERGPRERRAPADPARSDGKLKPEAAYFYPDANGSRSGILVLDMEESWQIIPTVEPMFRNLHAKVHLSPVMNGEDLQRGLKEAGS